VCCSSFHALKKTNLKPFCTHWNILNPHWHTVLQKQRQCHNMFISVPCFVVLCIVNIICSFLSMLSTSISVYNHECHNVDRKWNLNISKEIWHFHLNQIPVNLNVQLSIGIKAFSNTIMKCERKLNKAFGESNNKLMGMLKTPPLPHPPFYPWHSTNKGRSL